MYRSQYVCGGLSQTEEARDVKMFIDQDQVSAKFFHVKNETLRAS